MAYRFQCAAVLALFLFSVVGAHAQADYPYNPACMLSSDSCSTWITTTTPVHLPDYPGCEVLITYSHRVCPDLPSPHWVDELIVREIYWPTGGVWNDSTQPCFNLQTAYLSTAASLRIDFLHKLFQDAVEVTFRGEFEETYKTDSLALVGNPTNTDFMKRYNFLLCGNGKKTYRVINGLCMAAVTKPDVPFTGTFGRAEEKGEKGTSVAGGPPHSATNYMRVRYVPCFTVTEIPCCIQTLQFCRNPLTGETIMDRRAAMMGEATACSTSVPLVALQPGETSTGCRDYCLDYQAGTQPKGNGESPKLSGSVDRAFRLEEVRYVVPETINQVKR